MKLVWTALSGIILSSFLCAGAFPGAGAQETGQKLFEKKCGTCHSIGRPKSQGKTRAGWQATVVKMKKHGAVLADEEVAAIVDYLAAKYPER